MIKKSPQPYSHLQLFTFVCLFSRLCQVQFVLPMCSCIWKNTLFFPYIPGSGTIDWAQTDLTKAILYRKLILPVKPANVHSSSVRSRAHETLSPHDRMLISLTLCRPFSGKPQQLQQSSHVSSRRQCFVLVLL